jgi:ABC-type glycerol-3-phosphate transport system permease component
MATQTTLQRAQVQAGRRYLGKKARTAITRGVAYLLLTLGGLLMALPFFWLASSSLKPIQLIYVVPPIWIPDPPRWKNYADIFKLLPFGLYMRNTMLIVVGAMIGQVLTGAMSAYAFARLRWPGRDLWFGILLATMMLPGAVTMIPRFIIFKWLGWLDTFAPLIVPFWMGGSAFSVFLLRQFFLTIPMDLEDAARIDGASSPMIFGRIILPLAIPAMTVVAIFSFLGHWNDFMGPLIYLNTSEKRTLALGINSLQGLEWGRDNTELLMAAGVVMVMPTILIFIVAQDVFVQGIVMTGIKG